MSSPTSRSLEALRKEGYAADVSERYLSFARVRKDLFGFIDIVALKDAKTLAVQACSYGDVAKRVKKIRGHLNFPAVLAAGWLVEVWGWHKKGARWVVRRVKVTDPIPYKPDEAEDEEKGPEEESPEPSYF